MPEPVTMLWTMQEHIRSILGGKCDSAVLELQKFPELPSDGRHPQKSELEIFCRKIEKSKDFLPEEYALPEAEDGMSYPMELTSGGRLLVDHAGGLIENSNLCLHRLFGFPMIPGSALKGIARAYAQELGCDTEQRSRIFGGLKKGNSERQGNIVFLPAIPTNKNWKMVVDVLSPHYGCDTKNPVPVFFPAVEQGATFRFMLKKLNTKTSDEDLEAAADWLYGALITNGVGAKTSAGYGWFREA